MPILSFRRVPVSCMICTYNIFLTLVAFYVDDNKLSHVSSKVVDDILDTIEGYFFPARLLVTERGKCLNFLGMEIEFIGDKKIAVGTVQYIKAMIVKFGEELLKKVSSPAVKWLFVTDEKSSKLSGERADQVCKICSKTIMGHETK